MGLIKTSQPALHGDQHLEDGSDPIPGIGGLPPVPDTAGDYPLTILSLPDLRGYWRLGESASPFADTSGYVGTPANLNYNTGSGGTTAATFDITPGLLPAATDDGAIGFNNQGNTASGANQKPFLEAAAAAARFDFSTSHAFSVVARVKPYTPGATAFVGGIISHTSTATGQPLSGWGLHVNYPTIQPQFFRGLNPSNMTTVTAPAVTADEAHTLAATYDGTTSRLYVDGALAASSPDANTLASPHSSTRIRIGGYDPMRPSFGDWRPFYGVIDEVAVYGSVLTDDQVADLHAAAAEGTPAGYVLTSDGAGGTTWAVSTIEVQF